MSKRKITRVAKLQDYKGKPEELFASIPEVRQKGYQAVGFHAFIENLDWVRRLTAEADAVGLRIHLFTGYMKYQYEHLAQHPEQRIVRASAQEAADQDGISTARWGCPFNLEFKKRYFDFLAELAALPGIEIIFVNDEATLDDGCYCSLCRAEYRAEMGGDMPSISEASEAKWRAPEWRQFIGWRMERWNRVHGEMRDAVAAAAPHVKVAITTTPMADLCWRNPWRTGVDLSRIIDHVDGIQIGPYYTFHSRRYDPAEVYLSEWCRFLHGVVPDGKFVMVCPQLFSHPTFTRPLDERDGYWAAVIPVACGADYVAPYTYSLMGCAKPVADVYERCMSYDGLFEQVQPLRHVGIVHAANTEIFLRPVPVETPGSFDGARVLCSSESLRHKGIPYGYVPDARLTLDTLSQYDTVVLPEVDCLDDEQEAAIKEYWRQGGNLIALGQLGIADATGARHGRSLLTDLFGVEVVRESAETREIALTEDGWCQGHIPVVDDEAVSQYMAGANRPLMALNHCLDVRVHGGAQVLAEFAGRPAVVMPKGDGHGGKLLYIAGFPSRTVTNTRLGTVVRNLAHWILPAAVEHVCTSKPTLRVEGWPPPVPMDEARPFDKRYLSTFEFFPLVGPDLYVGVVVSYFREPTEFQMVATIPDGKTLKDVRELVSGADVEVQTRGPVATIDVAMGVAMGYDDAMKIFVFALA